MSGSPHQIPSPMNTATKTGASAVPRPSSALSASTATSTRRGNSDAASELTTGIVSPKPIPMRPVAPSRKRKGGGMRPQAKRLDTSSAIDARSAPRPSKRTRFSPHRRASRPPSSAAVTARTVWGANMTPYSPFDRPYACGSVNTALAAGNVTSARPCSSPAV